MKKVLSLLIALGFILPYFPLTASAAVFPTALGGTGWGNFVSGAVIYGNGTSPLATTTAGTDGQALFLLNGIPKWASASTTAASSTLLVDNNTFSGNNLFSASTTFSTLVNIRNASTSLSTFGTAWFPNITAYSLIATDANNKAVATSSIGNSLLANSSVTVNTNSPLGGGGAVSLGGTLTLTCATCSGAAGANPTASIGLSTVNGSASTFLRSDGAPALSQGITPTWTALHIFSANASSTQFSSYTRSYFGSTGTSTFNSVGNLTMVNVANALTIPFLGTAAGTFLAADPSGNVISTTTPGGSSLTGTTGQVPYFSGTNTAVGTSTIFISTAQNVGISSSSPSAFLAIGTTNTAIQLSSTSIWKKGGTYNITVPSGTVSISVQAWGAGGGGAQGTGGGGGAGAYIATTSSAIIAGSSVTVIVGTGGGGGAGAAGGTGGAGFAAGGTGGAATNGGGGGGGSSALNSSVIASGGGGGGNGASGVNGATGSSGGLGDTGAATRGGGGGGGSATVGGNGSISGNAAGGTGGSTQTGTNGGNNGSSAGGSSAGVGGNGNNGSGSAGGSGSGGASGGTGCASAGTNGTGANSGGGGGGNSTGTGGAGGIPGGGGGSCSTAGGSGGDGEVILNFYSLVMPIPAGQSAAEYIYSPPTLPASIIHQSMVIAGVISTYITQQIDSWGHLITGGPAPTCGAGCASIQGDDRNMRILTGSSVSTVVANFANTYTKTPICIANEESIGTVSTDASSTPTAVTVTTASALTTKFIVVHCEISNNFTF